MKGNKNSYMKTKKALAGLLGLLGSFVAFPFLVGAFPAFVEALPFLFTESLPPYTNHTKNMNTKIYIYTYTCRYDRETDRQTERVVFIIFRSKI